MARATTATWLPLDRYAEIMGINPLWFNSVYHSTLASNDTCDIFFQYAWQNANAISREDIARAIREAERRIAQYVGYMLIPDWVHLEEQKVTRPRNPALFNVYSTGPRDMYKSVFPRWAHVVSGGIKAKTLIDDAAAIVRSDVDGDGYQETCTVTVTTTVTECEIRAYFPGRSGADQYEIRPITVSKSGNTATITFKIWQVVDPDLTERLDAAGIDATVVGNFETTVDIYRVYNDPQTQVQFLWEQPDCSNCGGSGCTACQLGSQNGCLTVRDNRLGSMTYRPATWDSTNEEFDSADWSDCREPDRLRLSYYSGYRSAFVTCNVRDMDPELELAVAYYATALMDRLICNCENVQRFAERWREDLTLSNSARSYQNSQAVIDNPFGPWRGAAYAWSIANQEGRKVARF